MNKIRMLCSDLSHMPLHTIFRHSGVAEKHGFELEVDIANIEMDGSIITMQERAPALLAGKYEFLSGLHHETYIYRAKGDKRFVGVNCYPDTVAVRLSGANAERLGRPADRKGRYQDGERA